MNPGELKITHYELRITNDRRRPSRADRERSVAPAADPRRALRRRPITRSPNHQITRSTRRSRSAFTLVEMVVVIAVILILLGLVLPAATSMWSQRRIADAQNLVNGVLRSTRSKAVRGDRGDMGLFFYVDDDGLQRVVTIARDPVDPDDPPATPQPPTWRTDLNWRNVYTVTAARGEAFPAGMRVVPNYALITEQMADEYDPQMSPHDYFTALELANDDLATVVGNQAQRHRNYFTIVFASDGRLLPGQTVLIRDPDLDGPDQGGDGFGDRTGLPVESGLARYYDIDDSVVNFDPNHDLDITDLIVGATGDTVALNFRSVDGLLVYEDSLFREAPTPEDKRQVLVNTGQPYYIHHLTGSVVRGPAGENEPPG